MKPFIKSFVAIMLSLSACVGQKEPAQNDVPDSSAVIIKDTGNPDSLRGLITQNKNRMLFLSFWNGMDEDLYIKVADLLTSEHKLGKFDKREPDWQPTTWLYFYEFTIGNDGSVKSFAPIGHEDEVTFILQLTPHFENNHLKSLGLYNPHYRSPEAPLNVNDRDFHGDGEFATQYKKIEDYFSKKIQEMYKGKYGLAKKSYNTIDKVYSLRWERTDCYVTLTYTTYYGHVSLKSIEYADKYLTQSRQREQKLRKDSIIQRDKGVI